MNSEINSFPQVLTIAGTDSGGGAGMMADLKTMQECHTFSTGVIIAVTAQNTLGVQQSFMLPKEIIDAQFASIAADFQIRACKTGMLGDVQHVQYVVNNLKKYDFGPLIVDPVMVAKGGAILLTDEAISLVKQQLFPLATVITPNIIEAQRLVDQEIKDANDIKLAAKKLQDLGAKNVIIKGGHAKGQQVSDYCLFLDHTDLWLNAPRIITPRTHGTGDTLSACICSQIARGIPLKTAVHIAKDFINLAIKKTIQVGHGHGPLNHWAYQEVNKNAEL
ncbi:bifunctional hydroxymethylpyrimidine kinase/phosphomethylpyrimidine kinase [Bombilactobacillus thymidiniphilus]|uniref:Hydroxymethylpyrimidine/phosphomethylpyrimidine kinase n=1 Tax=Bombilactobacillus thymidiniphilus TaxID=2923363 RepID=A0ABY4PD21_9LACO|nr:bifunctional hydroxymethylpyrimidine kinase/phosphomethylpyrimidine kinase [Bombilactobacillus thymidiniphilus]UQS83416.1 bifunctional hydroxymethylpyrimidine kinase/phosphomethylpyrimidine kinase [Bombilactobacillus thymidiniphilus]